MTITRVVDPYNSNKIWIIKKSKCHHYYLNQENSGRLLNKGFKRVTRKMLLDIGILG